MSSASALPPQKQEKKLAKFALFENVFSCSLGIALDQRWIIPLETDAEHACWRAIGSKKRGEECL